MKIAVDYDRTYTADAKLFQAFILMAQALGHEVFIVTMRREGSEAIGHAIPGNPLVYYTERQAKRGYMRREGIEIDVWVDDDPVAILTAYDAYVPADSVGGSV